MVRIVISSQTLIVLLLFLFSSTTIAQSKTYKQSARTCTGDNICLTSFEWCSGSGDCDYPDNTLPLRPIDQSGNGLAGLDPDGSYDLSWKNSRSGVDVLVEWVLGEANATSSDDEIVVWWTS